MITKTIAVWTGSDMEFFNDIVVPAWDRATDKDPRLQTFLSQPVEANLLALMQLAIREQGGEDVVDRLPVKGQIVVLTFAVLCARVNWNRPLMEKTSAWFEEAVWNAGWLDLLGSPDMPVQ